MAGSGLASWEVGQHGAVQEKDPCSNAAYVAAVAAAAQPVLLSLDGLRTYQNFVNSMSLLA